MAQPNYNFQKAERDRAKAAKKEAKLKEKQARKAAEDSEVSGSASPTAETTQD